MMKTVKKLISAALFAVILFSAALSANAAGSYFLQEGFYYGVKDGEAYVHGYSGSDWDMVIREKFLSYDVTSVEGYAFFENDSMEALSFYDAAKLRSLGDCAFARCTKLQYVTITSSVQEMGVGVFDGCTSLSYVRFSQGSLTTVPAQTFYGCSSLQTVVFGNEAASIGELAFANCVSLQAITLPDTIERIADNAFDGCTSLIIYCTKDSYALQYALAHEIEYVVTDADPEPEGYILGDADGDGETTVIDAAYIKRYAAFLLSEDRLDMKASDVDGNGDVSTIDAAFIQRCAAEMTTPYRIGERVYDQDAA